MSILVASFPASLLVASCGGPTACTPENHDLGAAPQLTPRKLPGGPVTTTACNSPRLEVIGSEADLRRLYDGIGGGAEGGVGAGTDAYPAVDFSRERVIVREGVSGEGISWVVARGGA
ncbi:MAG TPA: hypothetical protein VM925_13010, partial [Labilithrix sp.]|nr:hypothetical protein [Labilithrix sp.]